MNKYTKYLNVFVVIALLLSFAVPAVAQSPAPAKKIKVLKDSVTEVAAPQSVTDAAPVATGLDPNPKQARVLEQMEATEVVGLNEPAVYIIQFQDPALAMYKGGINGMEPTHAGTRGEKKLDVHSAASQSYLNYLESRQAVALSDIAVALDRKLAVRYQYKYSLNGVSLEMTAAEAQIVAGLPEVKHVERDREYELHTDAGPTWLGAPSLWNGTATGGLPGTMGEGIIVGVIDTGIDPWNPSFADVGDDLYDHTNPYGSGNYVGVCDPADASYDSTFPCNDKLIGAWGYDTGHGGEPRDYDGHGSHTASTAAGNFVNGSLITVTDGTTFTSDISGVAPHANIIAYAACCDGEALNAARDQAVADGVDVINYSIGSDVPTGDPYNDAESMQWLAMREAGIWVATSAGNNGPGDATLYSPGDIPWMTTVGANSHDRTFLNTLVMTNGNALSPTVYIEGESMTGALITPSQIVLSSWYTLGGTISDDDARLCADGVFPDGTFDGEIVVCERGIYGRVDKGQTVLEGGAAGFILAQPDEVGGGPGGLSTDPHVLPAVHINYYEYQALLTALSSGYITGTIAGSSRAQDPMYGDIMASFSSRGPNQTFADIIEPSVTAPGRAIWAAYIAGPGGDGDYTYNVIQGTSMSSPHVAGALALLKALHPGWSAAEGQSALMLTSRNIVDDDGMTPATPFDQGSGHVDLTGAARAGFVLDITRAEYEAINPDVGGDPATLNLASFGQDECLGMCSWTRMLTSTLDYTVTWAASYVSADGVVITVTPASFELAPYATQQITVEADLGTIPLTETWKFAEMILTPDVVTPSVAHFPVAVDPTPSILPDVLEIDAHRDAGSVPVDDLRSIAASDLTIGHYGLAGATSHEFGLGQAVTLTGGSRISFPDIFFQGMTGTQYIELMVPADGGRLVAEILETTSLDLDMLVFRDLNDNATPELSDVNDEACQSASGGPYEFCDIMMPAAGRWYVAVINYEASDTPPDDVSLATAVVGGNAGNMIAAGPSVVEAGVPYDLRFYWDEPAMMTGDTWYGLLILGSDAAHAGDIGMIPVNIYRLEDDVTKMVDPMYVHEGETVTYTIMVEPNMLPEDVSYMLTDTIPTGMTYVPGSLQASEGAVSQFGGVITWSGVMSSMVGVVNVYEASTNATDPMCNTGLGTGGYVDLEGYNFFPLSNVVGDTSAWTTFVDQNPIQFYGIDNAGVNFTDDGFAFFDSTPGNEPWTNTGLPDPNDPNDLAAILWSDGEIVYANTPGSVAGVTLVAVNSDISIIEYDDLRQYPAEDGIVIGDFEVIFFSTIDDTPGAYEIVYAYDNIQNLPSSATIGTENVDATGATEVLFGDPSAVVTDGLVICFDYQDAMGDPVIITYQATVDEGMQGETITNTVYHETDNPGSMVEMSEAVLMVTNNLLTINIVGGGVVELTPDLPSYIPDTQVMMEAVADPFWVFDGWSGDMTLLMNPVTITMDSDKVVTATFVENQAPVAVDDSAVTAFETAVTVDVLANDSDPEGGVLSVAGVGTAGDGVVANNGMNVTYTPTTGFSGVDTFTYTVSDGELTDEGMVTITVTEAAYYDLDVAVVGNGSVILAPAGGMYMEDTEVMMTANPDSGWVFDGWSGDVVSTDNPYTVTMDSDKAITATFTALPTYTLEVHVVGGGSVSRDPDQTVFVSGETVQLTAVPNMDWYFAGWSGDLGGADNPATLTMDSDKVVTATFTSEPVVTYTLTVSVTGSGMVTVVPNATTFVSGTVVQLTAVPDTGWGFDAWSGSVISTTNPLSIVMDEDKMITATFIEVGEEHTIYLPLVLKH